MKLGNKILLIGDMHGNFEHLQSLAVFAKELNVTSCIMLGDSLWMDWFNDKFHSEMQSSGIPWYIIDGNHDNLCMDAEAFQSTEPYWLADGIYYIPRGYVHFENNTRYVFIGGANSVDKDSRTEFFDWWPNEAPSQKVLWEVAQLGKFDDGETIVFSHDAPENPVIYSEALMLDGNPYTMSNNLRYAVNASKNLRQELGFIAKDLGVNRWFHGHWHKRYTSHVLENPETEVIGLDMTSDWATFGYISSRNVNTAKSTYILQQ